MRTILKFMQFVLLFSLISITLAACGGGGGGEGGFGFSNGSSNNTPTSEPSVNLSISGLVSGDIKQGVTIALSGAVTNSIMTDASGLYSFTGLANGSYTVTPSLEGYTFTPTTLTLVVSGADVIADMFTAIKNIGTFYFSLSSVAVDVDQDFTLDAIVDPDNNNIVGAEVNISYDPSKFSLNSVTCSAAFSNTLYAPTIPSVQDGLARIDCAVPVEGSFINKISTVATFSFRALAPVNSSSIIFTDESTLGLFDKKVRVTSERLPAFVSVIQ